MKHTLVVLVEDKPGVLNRVASLFRRRAFNIDSLSVGRTAEPGVSRMTIVIDSDQAIAERRLRGLNPQRHVVIGQPEVRLRKRLTLANRRLLDVVEHR